MNKAILFLMCFVAAGCATSIYDRQIAQIKANQVEMDRQLDETELKIKQLKTNCVK